MYDIILYIIDRVYAIKNIEYKNELTRISPSVYLSQREYLKKK